MRDAEVFPTVPAQASVRLPGYAQPRQAFSPSGLVFRLAWRFFYIFFSEIKISRIFDIFSDKHLLFSKCDYGEIQNIVNPSMQIFLRILFAFCLTNSVSMLRHEIDVILPVHFE